MTINNNDDVKIITIIIILLLFILNISCNSSMIKLSLSCSNDYYYCWYRHILMQLSS